MASEQCGYDCGRATITSNPIPCKSQKNQLNPLLTANSLDSSPHALISSRGEVLISVQLAPLHRSLLSPLSIGPGAGVHRQNGHSASSSQDERLPGMGTGRQSRQARDAPSPCSDGKFRNEKSDLDLSTAFTCLSAADHPPPPFPRPDPIQDPGLNNGQVPYPHPTLPFPPTPAHRTCSPPLLQFQITMRIRLSPMRNEKEKGHQERILLLLGYCFKLSFWLVSDWVCFPCLCCSLLICF